MQDVHAAQSAANVRRPEYKAEDDEQMAQLGQEASEQEALSASTFRRWWIASGARSENSAQTHDLGYLALTGLYFSEAARLRGACEDPTVGEYKYVCSENVSPMADATLV